MNTYSAHAVVPTTAYDGRDRAMDDLLHEQIEWLRDALRDDAPAIAPGLHVECSGIGTNKTIHLMVDMYRGDRDATSIPYDERYVEIGTLDTRPSDGSLWELDPEYGRRSWDDPLLASEETVGIVIECVARHIAAVVGGGARVMADARGHATVALDHADASPAPITHGSIPSTVAMLRDDARALTAAAVADALTACHPDAASCATTDVWPEITVHGQDGETVLAGLDYSPDHDDAIVLTGPDGRSHLIRTGAHEPVDWRDEDDIVRPVCDAVRAALDA